MVNTKVAMCSTDVQLYLLSKYEQAYGIFDHANDKDPYSYKLVEQHDAETVYDRNSPLAARIRTYYRLKINEAFGMTLKEYLDLPRYVQDLMQVELQALKLDEKVQHERAQKEIENEMQSAMDN